MPSGNRDITHIKLTNQSNSGTIDIHLSAPSVHPIKCAITCITTIINNVIIPASI